MVLSVYRFRFTVKPKVRTISNRRTTFQLAIPKFYFDVLSRKFESVQRIEVEVEVWGDMLEEEEKLG